MHQLCPDTHAKCPAHTVYPIKLPTKHSSPAALALTTAANPLDLRILKESNLSSENSSHLQGHIVLLELLRFCPSQTVETDTNDYPQLCGGGAYF